MTYPYNDVYDLNSSLSALFIELDIIGKSVFNDELPMSDGKITCKLPALVLTTVAGTETRLDCKNILQNTTLQFTFRASIATNRKVLVTIANEVIFILRKLKNFDLGAVFIKDVQFFKSRFVSESDVNLLRYDFDCIVYYYNKKDGI